MSNYAFPSGKRSRSAKPTVRYRKASVPQLPNGRRHQRRRKGATYLKRSQGFGGGSRRVRGSRGNDPRRAYALVIVGCAFILFAASVLWYANRGVDITFNGETVSVRINSSIRRVIDEQKTEVQPGDLLAVDDSVLEKGGGTDQTVMLDGKKIDAGQMDSVKLIGGEKLEVLDGEDLYEKHAVQATEIKPVLNVEGSGPVRYVETWGESGRSEIWTGEQTGKVVDRGVVKQPIDCVVSCTNVSPDQDAAKYVALTFDEAPSAHTEDILRILEEKGAQATFFVSGDKVSEYPNAVRAIADSDNELGTNAFSDTMLTELPAEELRRQVTDGFDAVSSVTGKPISLLRPPFGEFSDQNWADAMDLVSGVIGWNVDSGDWLLNGPQSVIDNVVGSVGNGSIVLLTDNDAMGDQTIEALPGLIDRLQGEGYTLVTVSDLIATDDDLAGKVNLGSVDMPASAALPVVSRQAEGSPTM